MDGERVKDAPVVLTEEGKGNKCAPIAVACGRGHWALRVKDDDHLRLLAGYGGDVARSYRKLPDYLLFAEPRARRRGGRGPDLLVLVCEMKSSEGGVARGARRQVRLGKLLAEYIVRLAMFAAGRLKEKPDLDIRAMVASPSFPRQVRARSATRADQDDARWELDPAGDMLIYEVSGDEALRLEDFF